MKTFRPVSDITVSEPHPEHKDTFCFLLVLQRRTKFVPWWTLTPRMTVNCRSWWRWCHWWFQSRRINIWTLFSDVWLCAEVWVPSAVLLSSGADRLDKRCPGRREDHRQGPGWRSLRWSGAAEALWWGSGPHFSLIHCLVNYISSILVTLRLSFNAKRLVSKWWRTARHFVNNTLFIIR